ncbi:MAG TPA: hypothetical protein VMF51_11445 [Nocardioides sp.]|uniref:hypothetical protein n=1 Tax=Nocardioides sp. TaxID=35761 RepID=UPI002CB5F09E|nr:hypothetical protein [Nocardioides sp.]HTW15737.1 hypothetical protein [Nocardioides sp.]
MTDSALRAYLRARLTRARLDRDRTGAAALRSAIAALENAEAVPVEPGLAEASSEHVAGAVAGLGAGEAARRVLSDAEERAIVDRERAELLDAATSYDAAGDPATAEATRRAAELLA